MALSKKQNTKIENSVLELLELVGVSRPPVPVERIARLRGAEIRYVPFEGEISGLIAREVESIIIGVTAIHSKERQRFTVAHEIAHLELGHLDSLDENIHVDRHFKVMLRSGRSSELSDPMEKEANSYAAQLLMPDTMLINETVLLDQGLDFEGDDLLYRLAHRYKVSTQAMTIRLCEFQSYSNELERKFNLSQRKRLIQRSNKPHPSALSKLV